MAGGDRGGGGGVGGGQIQLLREATALPITP